MGRRAREGGAQGALVGEAALVLAQARLGRMAPEDLASWAVHSNLWAGVAAVPSGLDDKAAPVPPATRSFAMTTLDRARLFSSCTAPPAARAPTDPECYRPRHGGPLGGSGAPIGADEIALMSLGFFGEPRDLRAPSIGFAEPGP